MNTSSIKIIDKKPLIGATNDLANMWRMSKLISGQIDENLNTTEIFGFVVVVVVFNIDIQLFGTIY